ncbi:hypothetical protein Tco_1541222 [Tanacetum coccineum]
MESEKYLEGQSMQRPPLFESDGFIYWKNRFKTYVKSKDLDLWHVITDGDFPPIQNNPETKKDEVVPFQKQNDDLKKKLAKNNEAKMISCIKGEKGNVSDEISSRSICEDEEYPMAVKRIQEILQESRKDLLRQPRGDRTNSKKVEMMLWLRAWSDNKEDEMEKTKDETCLVAQQPMNNYA